MVVFRGILTVLLVLISIALVVVILSQKGKKAGLLGGAFGGNSTDTFWSQNKGRSKEGRLDLITRILVAAFLVVALLIGVLGKFA